MELLHSTVLYYEQGSNLFSEGLHRASKAPKCPKNRFLSNWDGAIEARLV